MRRRPRPASRAGCVAPSAGQLDWASTCSLPVYQNLSGDVTSDRQTRQDLAPAMKEAEELIRESVMLAPRGPASGLLGRGSSGGCAESRLRRARRAKGGVPP